MALRQDKKARSGGHDRRIDEEDIDKEKMCAARVGLIYKDKM